MFFLIESLPSICLLVVVQLMVVVGPSCVYGPEFLAWVPENVRIHRLPGTIQE